MISVIIPTYNEEKYIEKCLESLKKCETSDYEIIIVDGKSTDKTVKICGGYTDRILIEDKKEGIAIARNKGVEIARGDIVAFLDADSVPSEGWLDAIEDSFKNDTIAAGGPIEHGIKWLDFLYKMLFYSNVLHKTLLNICIIYENNSAWRKERFLELQGFRNFIGEGFDICIRARKYAKKIKINGNMKVRLSRRRFEQEGLVKTHLLWTKAIIYNRIGMGIPHREYKGVK